jgi:hypothetical protein
MQDLPSDDLPSDDLPSDDPPQGYVGSILKPSRASFNVSQHATEHHFIPAMMLLHVKLVSDQPLNWNEPLTTLREGGC